MDLERLALKHFLEKSAQKALLFLAGFFSKSLARLKTVLFLKKTFSMESQDTTAAIYSEAKSEYTKQLIFNFQPVLLRFFLDRFTEVKAASPGKALSEFQTSLSQIPEWNLDKVQKETTALLQAIHCDYIEDLITAVFIAHTKILSAIRLHAKPRRKIQITVPKPDHFMHRALSESSRLLWSNVYLFNDASPSLERQKYMNDVNRFLEEGILQAIRNLLPVKSILRDSLQEDEDDGIQITTAEKESKGEPEPEAEVEPVKPVEPVEPIKPVEPVEPEVKAKELKVEKVEEIEEFEEVKPKVQPQVKPQAEPQVKPSQPTFVVDTEKSVGFTGMDSLLGEDGEAELRPMIEEGDNDLKIVGSSEDLSSDDIDELDFSVLDKTPIALSADDYETL